MSRLLRKIVRLLNGSVKTVNEDRIFRQKVRRIMKDEKDFSPLYDYDVIAGLNEKGRMDYLRDITMRYLSVKSEILQCKNLKQ